MDPRFFPWHKDLVRKLFVLYDPFKRRLKVWPGLNNLGGWACVLKVSWLHFSSYRLLIQVESSQSTDLTQVACSFFVMLNSFEVFIWKPYSKFLSFSSFCLDYHFIFRLRFFISLLVLTYTYHCASYNNSKRSNPAWIKFNKAEFRRSPTLSLFLFSQLFLLSSFIDAFIYYFWVEKGFKLRYFFICNQKLISFVS